MHGTNASKDVDNHYKLRNDLIEHWWAMKCDNLFWNKNMNILWIRMFQSKVSHSHFNTNHYMLQYLLLVCFLQSQKSWWCLEWPKLWKDQFLLCLSMFITSATLGIFTTWNIDVPFPRLVGLWHDEQHNNWLVFQDGNFLQGCYSHVYYCTLIEWIAPSSRAPWKMSTKFDDAITPSS
jgi:hypothetical protein